MSMPNQGIAENEKDFMQRKDEEFVRVRDLKMARKSYDNRRMCKWKSISFGLVGIDQKTQIQCLRVES